MKSVPKFRGDETTLRAIEIESVHEIATDLEAATNILSDLLSMAYEELAGEGRRALTLINAAGRYAEDVKLINARLYAQQTALTQQTERFHRSEK
jgi:hypothetical protein